jgi:hypothetical protein
VMCWAERKQSVVKFKLLGNRCPQHAEARASAFRQYGGASHASEPLPIFMIRNVKRHTLFLTATRGLSGLLALVATLLLRGYDHATPAVGLLVQSFSVYKVAATLSF